MNNGNNYRRRKKKKQNAMGVFTLLVMLVIAVAVILVTALLLKGGNADNTSLPDTSTGISSDTSTETSADVSVPATSTGEPVSTPAVSKPEESKPAESTPDVSNTEKYTYKTDVSSYMWAIEPENRDAYLVLVNYENFLSSSYKPEDLVAIRYTRADRNDELMIKEAETALYAFLNEAKEYGYDDVTVTSAYRSYAKQQYLFDNKVNNVLSSYATREEAEAAAAKVVARPGTSEHQSGMTCDMHNMSSAQQSFGKTDEAKWLAENAYKFGFILRYPEDKQDITKIIYEPWHFRYVGRYHATQMKELGMCLEEYTEYLANK